MKNKLTHVFTSSNLATTILFIKSYLKLLVPSFLYIMIGERKICSIIARQDIQYIKERVDYYCKLQGPFTLPKEAVHEKQKKTYKFIDFIKKYSPSTFHKAYFFDLFDATKWTSRDYRVAYIPGDIDYTPEVPSFVKSRPLTENNQNSVILKLDQHSNFEFIKDYKEWRLKNDMVIFIGKIGDSSIRELFREKYFETPFCDSSIVGDQESFPQYIKPKKTKLEHLDYKFIMTLEGNDVTSNLAWIMSSNSIAVMPKPTHETWFMEGKLIPNVHYIEIKPDLSDLKECMDYYIAHPEDAEQIIANAHEFVEQFLDEEREEIIQHLVVEKYRYFADAHITKSNI